MRHQVGDGGREDQAEAEPVNDERPEKGRKGGQARDRRNPHSQESGSDSEGPSGPQAFGKGP
ncbi:hypothetical protein D3C77_802790 [compost metagenome]